MASREIDPWDLDLLFPEEYLEREYHRMEEFARWLRSAGIEVPGCWYVHRWSAYRLAALMHWHEQVYGGGQLARDAAEWWSSSWGLQGLRDAWQQADLFKHGDRHYESGKEEPTPTLDEVIRRHAGENRIRANGNGDDRPAPP